MTTFLKGLQSLKSFLHPTLETVTVPSREKFVHARPRKRFPPWFIKQNRGPMKDDHLTRENKEFIQQTLKDRYPQVDPITASSTSPLKLQTIEPTVGWDPNYRRVGIIARKIGIIPMWMKDGRKILTTMFQVADNHIIKYTPPEDYNPMYTNRKNPRPRALGCLIVGAQSSDPQMFTKEYCGMFAESGVMPKRFLARFQVSPEAALQPGTPLYAAHFRPGQFVDIRGKTIDRGWQGVMKRWGFHGMPASHGVTKTHRRPGNIGSGGQKARVMPGTKLPGHMGNRYRILKGLQVVRVNTKYNVIYVLGQATAGETNSLVTIHDTLLRRKSLKTLEVTPCFPTYFRDLGNEELPEELFVDNVHNFNESTIVFKEDE